MMHCHVSGQRSMPTMFHGKWIEHVGPASWPPDVTCFGFSVDIPPVPVVLYWLQ